MGLLNYLNNPIVYTVVGVFIGFSLTTVREYLKSRKVNNNIFTMIKTELEFNKTLLINFKENNKFKTNEISINCPNFSLKNWNNFLQNIPSIFDKNEDIILLYKFYNGLEILINSKYWVKPLEGQAIDTHGRIVKREYPFTDNTQEFIDFNKKKIFKEIDKLLDLYQAMSFNE